MKLGLPKNLFAAIWAFNLNDELKANVEMIDSSMLSKKVAEGEIAVALVPSCDLITHKEFFVSSKIGLTFDGPLSDGYFYFNSTQKDFSKILLKGDVSTNQILLSKIIFSEKYESDVELTLDTGEMDVDKNNYLVVGLPNFENSLFEKGISFSEEICDILDFPYVNYVLVAKDEKYINEIHNLLLNENNKIEEDLNTTLEKLKTDDNVKQFIIENSNAVYFDITENETTGLTELLKLVYYYGISDEVHDIKFVK